MLVFFQHVYCMKVIHICTDFVLYGGFFFDQYIHVTYAHVYLPSVVKYEQLIILTGNTCVLHSH